MSWHSFYDESPSMLFSWENRISLTTPVHKNHALDDRMHALCMIVICPVKLRYATICDDFDPKISLAKTLSETCRHISRFGTVLIPQSKILQSDWINQILVDVSRKVIEKWFYNQVTPSCWSINEFVFLKNEFKWYCPMNYLKSDAYLIAQTDDDL